MNDYIQIMKDIIQEYYSTTPEGNKIEMQTSAILRWFKGVIPDQPITEHDVFDVLTELGYKKSQKILTERIQTVKANKKEGIQAEYEDVEVARILVWNLYERIE
ncbi:hypothetical protein [Chryseobacterium sp. ZHDP1]|uniref:hypothetical protein n=1 Tax=Chryseobacterium sp. ZHDP1 TaxID=2838877 RepID=UPI001BE0B6E0|nr:hypothetical protein [Chryseobacterium sp. ZHDP1]QWA38889.1 hypothetical protein KKI44_01370 [Chryseobacterium sp. ZHDP1]